MAMRRVTGEGRSCRACASQSPSTRSWIALQAAFELPIRCGISYKAGEVLPQDRALRSPKHRLRSGRTTKADLSSPDSILAVKFTCSASPICLGCRALVSRSGSGISNSGSGATLTVWHNNTFSRMGVVSPFETSSRADHGFKKPLQPIVYVNQIWNGT